MDIFEILSAESANLHALVQRGPRGGERIDDRFLIPRAVNPRAAVSVGHRPNWQIRWVGIDDFVQPDGRAHAANSGIIHETLRWPDSSRCAAHRRTWRIRAGPGRCVAIAIGGRRER